MPKHKSEKWLSVIRSPEYRQKMKEISKKNGNKPPVRWGNKDNFGRKHTKEWKERMREIAIEKGLKPPISYGKNHPNWKGGTTKLRTNIMGMFEYRQWRSDIFTKDNFTCQDCLIRGGDLEVHHIKPISVIIEEYHLKTLEEARNCAELWNTNNGITLCKECHRKTFS